MFLENVGLVEGLVTEVTLVHSAFIGVQMGVHVALQGGAAAAAKVTPVTLEGFLTGMNQPMFPHVSD
jgi:hypothetical protein